MIHPREAKLPKWAQEELLFARRERDRAVQALEGLKANSFGPADTNTFVGHYGSPELNLPKGETVSFRLGDTDQDIITARVRHAGELEIMGLDNVLVIPQAANVVIVVPRRRFLKEMQ